MEQHHRNDLIPMLNNRIGPEHMTMLRLLLFGNNNIIVNQSDQVIFFVVVVFLNMSVRMCLYKESVEK